MTIATVTQAEWTSQIIALHALGKSDRQIATQVGIDHKTVAKYRRANDLSPRGETRGKLIIIGDSAICSRCGELKPLADWPVAREGKKFPYRLTYCRACRRRQVTTAQNKTLARNINVRWLRLVARSKKLGVRCTVSSTSLLEQWHEQNGKCFYTDADLLIDYGCGRGPQSASIDKIDPRLGYISGNTVFASTRANTIKHDLTPEEMAVLIPLWHERVVAMWRRRGIPCLQVAEGDF